MKQVNRLDKFLTAIALLVIVGALVIIANTPPASGYELSIYNAYPGYFWFLFILSISLGIIILVRQSLTPLKSRWWLAGLGIVILSNLIFLLIPFLRGYAFYPGGDAMTHISIINGIIDTGFYSDQNVYPVVHVLGAEISLVTGIGGRELVPLMSLSWYVIYLLNVYLLALVLSKNHRQAIFIVALASPLVYGVMHSSIQPHLFSIFMLPLLLYLHHKRMQIQRGKIYTFILFILVAALITFTHPVTLLFVVVVFFTFELTRILYLKFITHKGIDMQDSVGIGGFSVALIMLVLFSLWYFQQPHTEFAIRSAYDTLFLGTGSTLFQDISGDFAQAGLSLSQTIELFFFRYGAVFIYLLLAIIAVGMVLWKSTIGRIHRIEQTHFIYSLLILAALAFSAFSLFGFTGELSPTRISRFFLLFSPIIIGLVSYALIGGKSVMSDDKGDNRPRLSAATVIIALLIIIISSLGIFNVYGSTQTMAANSQHTATTISGADWFLTYKDARFATASATINLRRYEHLLLGYENAIDNRAPLDSEWIPSHFGYDMYESIIEAYEWENRYLITWERDRLAPMVFPENVRPLVHQYNPEDYALLNNDKSTALVYANGEFEVYYVYRWWAVHPTGIDPRQ